MNGESLAKLAPEGTPTTYQDMTDQARDLIMLAHRIVDKVAIREPEPDQALAESTLLAVMRDNNVMLRALTNRLGDLFGAV